MYRKVFISYASEDGDHALEMYKFLDQNNYDPWLDKKKLLAGANWDLEIQKALKESDFILLLLSARSVAKRGYVQREFRVALEYSEYKLESDIFIIPVLLDDCQVPQKLQKFHWVSISLSDVHVEVLRALDAQRNIYLSEMPVSQIGDSHFEKSLSLNLPDHLTFENDIKFPQFADNPFFNADMINHFIQGEVMDSVQMYYKMALDEEYVADVPAYMKDQFYFSSNYEIHYISNRYLSLALHISYYWGGPHPNHHMITKNFAFTPERTLMLSDVVSFASLKDFLLNAIDKYGGDYLNGEGTHLVEYLSATMDSDHNHNLDFLFNSNELTLTAFNLLPHAFQTAGNISIPLTSLPLKIQVS